MMKRITKTQAKALIKEHQWHAADVACGHHAGWPEAAVLSDWGPYGGNYPGRKFIKSDIRKLPFKTKEFDFVIASHVVEHIPEVDQVLEQLMRVANAGYIEVPSPLFDNLTQGNDGKHKWWITFDDWEEKLIFRPREKVITSLLKVAGWDKHKKIFPESCFTAVYWAGQIKYEVQK